MACIGCGTDATSALLCSRGCGVDAEIELARNLTRLAELRQRSSGLSCPEARGLMDRNAEIREALDEVSRGFTVAS